MVEVAGCWMLELRDRYSWMHKILPLIMTGLHDEILETRVKGAEFWDKAGKQYMQENESDDKFKDKMDFLTEHPEHYPPNSKFIRNYFQKFNLYPQITLADRKL